MRKGFQYHPGLLSEIKEMAGAFFDAPPIARDQHMSAMRGELIASGQKAEFRKPIAVHVLGREPVGDLWAMVGLRDTIERAWHREEKYFTRTLEKEG